MEENTPKHAIQNDQRGTIKLSDFRPKNLHPKAKARVLMAIAGTLLIVFGCFYMLSMSTFYFETDMTTSEGLSNFFSNMVFFGYIIGSIFVILIFQ
jgi:succinate dehydrogenase/fumarate reductase cytochrome b subunit